MVATVEQIVLEPSGSARLEVVRSVPGTDGNAPHQRVISTKRTALTALFGDSYRAGPCCLPLRCRFHEIAGAYEVYVIEDEPQVRTLHWRMWLSAQERALRDAPRRAGEDAIAFSARVQQQDRFSLALPYVIRIYVFAAHVLDAVYCYYRNEPLRSHRDELFCPNLPNIYSTPEYTDPYRICLSRDARHCDARTSSCAEVIAHVESCVWGGVWNTDLLRCFAAMADRVPEFATPWHWEAASRRDPLFVLRVPWQETGQTIASALTRFLRKDVVRDAERYASLAARIRTAEVWDARAAASARGDERASPSRNAALQTGRALTIGDTLVLAPGAVTALRDGGTYAIEWFGYAALNGHRLVKLAGVDAPQMLIAGYALATGVTRGTAHAALPTVGGVTLQSGMRVCVDANVAAYDVGMRSGIVDDAWRDPDGAVVVQCVGAVTFVIGHGDALLDGITIEPPEEVDADGGLVQQAVTLGDGTQVHVGDRWWSRSLVGMLTVTKLLPLGREGRRCARCDRGVIVNLDDAFGRLHADLVRMPDAPVACAEVRGTTLRVGDVLRVDGVPRTITALSPCFRDGAQYVQCSGTPWHILRTSVGQLGGGLAFVPELLLADASGTVRLDSLVFPVGALLDRSSGMLVRAERFASDNPGEVVAVAGDGTRVPFIRDWRRVADVVPVVLEAQVAGIQLAAGTRLRSLVRIGADDAGTVRTVRCIMPPPTAADAGIMVVFEDGCGFTVTPGNCRCFEWQDAARGDQWEPFPDDATLYPAVPARGAPGEGLVADAAVQYLGGDLQTNFRVHGSEAIAMATPAHVVRRDGFGGCLVRFEVAISGCHDRSGLGGDRDQFIAAGYLVRIGALVLATDGFTRVFACPGQATARPTA